MNSVRIKQIFMDTDMRMGDRGLTEFLFKKKMYRDALPHATVYLFLNRKQTILKAVARRGIFEDRKYGKETFDFSLRREEILQSIGNFFGMEFSLPQGIYSEAKKTYKLKKVGWKVTAHK